MRVAFLDCKTRRTAVRYCPWAAIVVRVETGFMAFEDVVDYLCWTAQRCVAT
jgi:hypothetical protein